MSLPILTIGIPTYNRAEAVFKLLEQIVEHQIYSIAQILVIDDGGTDGSYDKLTTTSSFVNENIIFLRNKENIGYARTFVRMFSECRTKYLMMIADDDLLIPENIKNLITYLESVNPDFVSPQYLLKDGKVYRGRRYTHNILRIFFLPQRMRLDLSINFQPVAIVLNYYLRGLNQRKNAHYCIPKLLLWLNCFMRVLHANGLHYQP